MVTRVKKIHWSSQSEWFDMPKQERSRETMRRIFDVAITLLARNGYDATTMVDIAREAGVTTGSIYRRFTDKESLLYTIIEAFDHTRMPETTHMVDPVNWQDSSAEEIAEFYVQMILSSYRSDEQIIRIIEQRGLSDQKALGILEVWNSFVWKSFANLFRMYEKQLSCDDIDESMEYLHWVVRSALVKMVLPNGSITGAMKTVHDPKLDAYLLKITRACMGLYSANGD